MRPTQNNERRAPAKSGRGKEKRVTLGKAITDEVKDNVRDISLKANIERDDVVRGVICAFLIIFYAVLQTTFFARFRPFGAVPDLMLLLTVAMGQSEGEKFGSLTGIFAAFVIESIGTASFSVSFLPLLYFAAGCAVGLLNKYVFGDTFAMKTLYALFASLAKTVYNAVFTSRYNGAPFGKVLTNTVIPEFFSTLLLAVPVILTVMLAYRYFHRSRAERTNDI